MGVPADTFKATVARYNELAKKGNDDDFGKVAFRLSTLEKSAVLRCQALICAPLQYYRLEDKHKMQVLNNDLEAIPGTVRCRE